MQYRARAARPRSAGRAIAMLRRVGIPDPERRIDRYPHEFSGGMRQRICIALALIAGPDLLIADEPTTALDVTLEAQIIQLLRELKDEVKGSILFVSHHLGLVAELCDRVTVMYAGEVVETGTVHDVFHRPRHPYTQALLRCDPARIEQATRELPTIAGEVPSLTLVPEGCVFRPRCPYAFERCVEPPPLYPAADRAPFRIRGMRRAATCSTMAELLRVDDLVVRYRAMGPMAALLAGIRDPFVDAVLEVSFALARGRRSASSARAAAASRRSGARSWASSSRPPALSPSTA